MTVQPWEPVSFGWSDFGVVPYAPDRDDLEDLFDGEYDPLHVTLANGQKIIVRAKR